MRLLYPEDGWSLLEGAVCDALQPALDRVEALFGKAAFMRMAPDGFDRNYWAFRYIQGREAWLADGATIEGHGLALGPGVRERFAFSKDVTDAQVEDSQVVRREVTARLASLLGTDGVLVLPTMPDIAPLLTTGEDGLENYRNNAIKLLCLAGLSGFPQLSMPLATRLGAPLGLSLLGPAGSDRSLIAMARRIADES